jgi:hypothetical protein
MARELPRSMITRYNSSRYRVVQFDGSASKTVVILFTTWRASPRLDEPVFGEAFLQKLDMNYIAVRSAENDWFQGAIEPALDSVRCAIAGRVPLGYGSSMGAYAVLNFAAELGIERSVCFVPQSSIDPKKAPFELRWREEAALLDFHCDQVAEQSGTRATIIYDPLHKSDAQHVERISETSSVRGIKLRSAGHNIAQFLRSSSLISALSTALLTNENFSNESLRLLLRPLDQSGCLDLD